MVSLSQVLQILLVGQPEFRERLLGSSAIEQLRQQALDVATGNNRNALTVDRVDEIGMTMRTISQLGLMFRWLIDDVSQQVINVRSAVEEIAKGNMDLSERTERSAASVQQTASFMEQMTSTVEQNAGTSAQAAQLAQQSTQTAHQGGDAMHKVTDVMAEIANSSSRMNDIIGTIDSIAFQTNILALNAAVEAARAGDQGRGFAVVAAEVRALAQRSATAAKEIKVLITACVDKVQSGGHMVAATQTEIETMVQQVQQVSTLIADISAATREQRDGIMQASEAVGQMDSATQQNAALVEQSAAAAQSLETQTQRLVEAVRVFH
jgi:aerotaxis receptor